MSEKDASPLLKAVTEITNIFQSLSVLHKQVTLSMLGMYDEYIDWDAIRERIDRFDIDSYGKSENLDKCRDLIEKSLDGMRNLVSSYEKQQHLYIDKFELSPFAYNRKKKRLVKENELYAKSATAAITELCELGEKLEG